MNKNLKSLFIPVGFVAAIAILFTVWNAVPDFFSDVFTVLWVLSLIVVPAIYTGLWNKIKTTIIKLFK